MSMYVQTNRSTHRAHKLDARVALAAMCLLLSAVTHAQQPKFQTAPATDSAAQASPINAPASSAAKPTDNAIQASPEVGPPTTFTGIMIRPGTAVAVRLTRAIDSGKLKNGDNLHVTLATSLKASDGSLLAVGSPATVSVIATVPAGKLNAVGEFSLQLISVGRAGVFTDIQTFRGEPGHRDLPDSAPTTGTDAGLAEGAMLTFHVQKPPTAADGPPKQGGVTPGSVDGRASGSAPANNSSQTPH